MQFLNNDIIYYSFVINKKKKISRPTWPYVKK